MSLIDRIVQSMSAKVVDPSDHGEILSEGDGTIARLVQAARQTQMEVPCPVPDWSQSTILDIPPSSAFQPSRIPADVRLRIARALINRECSTHFFVERGYSSQRLSEWKLQLEHRGDKSFVSVGRANALDAVALDEFKRLVQAKWCAVDDSMPAGLTSEEAYQTVQRLYRETTERRTGLPFLHI
jgi:hypothetical protein